MLRLCYQKDSRSAGTREGGRIKDREIVNRNQKRAFRFTLRIFSDRDSPFDSSLASPRLHPGTSVSYLLPVIPQSALETSLAEDRFSSVLAVPYFRRSPVVGHLICRVARNRFAEAFARPPRIGGAEKIIKNPASSSSPCDF